MDGAENHGTKADLENGLPALHTPAPWMTHRAGEMLPDDWVIMADMGKLPNGIQQVSTVARALSIRQTPEVTAANAAFIVRAVNSHDALVRAMTEMVKAFKPFTNRPMGAPNSEVRIEQQLQIAAHRNALAALAIAKATP